MSKDESNPSQPVVFGEFQNLMGILESPTEDRFPGVAVIILTPGMLHSAGPFRLHVDLAAALSESGLTSFRFDLSGIGESLASGGNGTSLERATAEIAAAIDYLGDHHGKQSVLLFGLCSGADDAIFAASHDERIQGVFALDGCGYRTARYHWVRLIRNWLPKTLSSSRWKNLVFRLLGVKPSGPQSLQLGDDIREFPAREESQQQLLALSQRGVGLHFHYTGGVQHYYNHAEQFFEMFPELHNAPGISTTFHPDSDHVGFLCEHRREIVQRGCAALVRMAAEQRSNSHENAESSAAIPGVVFSGGADSGVMQSGVH